MKLVKNLFRKELTPKHIRQAQDTWQGYEDEIIALTNTAKILGYAITERINKLNKLKEEITI